MILWVLTRAPQRTFQGLLDVLYVLNVHQYTVLAQYWMYIIVIQCLSCTCAVPVRQYVEEHLMCHWHVATVNKVLVLVLNVGVCLVANLRNNLGWWWILMLLLSWRTAGLHVKVRWSAFLINCHMFGKTFWMLPFVKKGPRLSTRISLLHWLSYSPFF